MRAITMGIRLAVVRGATAATEADFARTIVGELAQPHVVLARLWIATRGEDLELAASAGFPTGGGSYNRVDGEFRRVTGRVGKIGRIAADRTALIVRSIRGDEDWLSNPAWIARQGVRAFVGVPLVLRETVVGVLAIFDRVPPSDAATEDLQFLADYAAARIIDIRSRPPSVAPAAPDAPVLTRADLREIEKRAIQAALTRTGGKVFGRDGAAALLAMKPTTLASRIKTLGLRMR